MNDTGPTSQRFESTVIDAMFRAAYPIGPSVISVKGDVCKLEFSEGDYDVVLTVTRRMSPKERNT